MSGDLRRDLNTVSAAYTRLLGTSYMQLSASVGELF